MGLSPTDYGRVKSKFDAKRLQNTNLETFEYICI